ncbi:MAG TPA: hypothetical protein P5222_07410 [Candidatus Cloacimonadota bacterium]|nr:hypothetical protein [Candidatus Cloacimonadota bacterium]
MSPTSYQLLHLASGSTMIWEARFLSSCFWIAHELEPLSPLPALSFIRIRVLYIRQV